MANTIFSPKFKLFDSLEERNMSPIQPVVMVHFPIKGTQHICEENKFQGTANLICQKKVYCG